MAWVSPSTRTTGEFITAAMWNQDVVANPIAIRDGSATFPGGSATVAGATFNHFIEVANVQAADGSFIHGIEIGGYKAFGYASTGDYVVLGGYVNGQWTGARVYGQNAGTATLLATFAYAGSSFGTNLSITPPSSTTAITTRVSDGSYHHYVTNNAGSGRWGWALSGSGTDLSLYDVQTGLIKMTLEDGGIGTGGAFFYPGSGVFRVQAPEGTNAALELYADDGDDAGDRWKILASTSLEVQLDSVLAWYMTGGHEFYVSSGAFGTGAVSGAAMISQRNTSGSGAAGVAGLERRDGTRDYLWSDATGTLRIGGSKPTEDNTTVSDTSGTIVGTQTSLRSAKDHIEDFRADALDFIRRLHLHSFRYRNGLDGQFAGIMADEAPELMMDFGRAYSPLTADAYLFRAVQQLADRLDQVEARC